MAGTDKSILFISLYSYLGYLRNREKIDGKQSIKRHDPCMNTLLNSDGLKRKTSFNTAFRLR